MNSGDIGFDELGQPCFGSVSSRCFLRLDGLSGGESGEQRSANGAEYESQGQARSEAERVAPGKKIKRSFEP